MNTTVQICSCVSWGFILPSFCLSALYSACVCFSLCIHIFSFKLLYSISLLIKLLLQPQGRLFGFRSMTAGFLKSCSSSPPWCVNLRPALPTPSLGKLASVVERRRFWRRVLTCRVKDGLMDLGCTMKIWLQGHRPNFQQGHRPNFQQENLFFTHSLGLRQTP